jgi:hypothetical protein
MSHFFDLGSDCGCFDKKNTKGSKPMTTQRAELQEVCSFHFLSLGTFAF